MSDKDQQDRSAGAQPAEHPDAAEEKRLAARRRFLQKSAAGSGVAVLTLYHTNGYAGRDKGKKMILSSAEACMSLTGSPGKTVKKQDSVTPFIDDPKHPGHQIENKVEKQECVLK